MHQWLAVLMFLPWFAIVAWAYTRLPRPRPGERPRGAYDAVVIALGLGLAVLGMRWGLPAEHVYGELWPQVLATLLAYAAFLGVLLAGALLRARVLRPR